MDATLLVLSTCAWINIYQVDHQAADKSLSYGVSIGIFILLGACMIALFTYLYIKLKELATETVTLRVGQIYSGYVVHRDALYSVVTLFSSISRRIVLGAVITYGEENPLL